jgi:predicted AAA+ superfamily ATPase
LVGFGLTICPHFFTINTSEVYFGRYLESFIYDDALKDHKMAFLYGPRQVGKTTLSKNLLFQKKKPENYYNWDSDSFKRIWVKDLDSIISLNNYKKQMIVLDEIHKDKKWKNKLKGLYVLHKNECQIIVTGSARLDFFKKSGDSLLGRYIPYRLHPFTLGESKTVKPPPEKMLKRYYIFQKKISPLIFTIY